MVHGHPRQPSGTLTARPRRPAPKLGANPAGVARLTRSSILVAVSAAGLRTNGRSSLAVMLLVVQVRSNCEGPRPALRVTSVTAQDA